MSDPGGGGTGIHHRTNITRKAKKSLDTQDIGIQVNIEKKKGKCKTAFLWILWTTMVILGVLALIPVWDIMVSYAENMLLRKEFTVGSEMIEDLGLEGVIIFKQHDHDNDGRLSLEEFEPIAHRLLQINDSTEYELVIKESDDVITIQCYFTPLNLSTMSKAKDDDLQTSSGKLDSLHGLKYWKTPRKQWQNFAVSHLKSFLPSDPYLLEEVGQPYYLIKPQLKGTSGATLSSNRYVPPFLVHDQEIMIHQLLSMFHPRPFVFSRFAPQGSVAIVRAFNTKYVDIMFRIHAEFQLNEPPFYPFWFTPAQFTGNIIISKDGTKILSFNLYVPSEKRLNVDMEWLNGAKEEENMEVDIGHMERMQLRATRSSIYVHDGGRDYTGTYIPVEDEENVKNIIWDKEITIRKAARELEVKMYPFKKVIYYNFTEAYHVAQEVNKPVHSILLWGALDDQSC